jgi:hypothetical protein
MAKCPDA